MVSIMDAINEPIGIDDISSTDDDNLLTCALCLQKINSDRDRGYADTEGQIQCLVTVITIA